MPSVIVSNMTPAPETTQAFQMKKPQAFRTISGDMASGLLIIADHATNHVPQDYAALGLPKEAFERHIAFDIGVEPLTERLAAMLGAPAVLSCFSRLLIDPNRGEDDPTLIMKLSDGAVVPANHPLSVAERQKRIETWHRPYRQAIDAALAEVASASGKAPLVISLHSYTPYWKDFARPWEAAVLWDTDDRAVYPLIRAIEAKGYVVGDNEPYDGALKGDTMNQHCMRTGIPHALLEVRQDLIGNDKGVEEWANVLAPIFSEMNAMPELHEYRIYPSRAGSYD
jgi:predicted N-formylglutamate amidohydrolase